MVKATNKRINNNGMIDDPLEFSSVFSDVNEDNRFLLRMKRSVLAHFKFSIVKEVGKVYFLAYWLHVFKRDKEAIAVCDFLLQKEFDGNVSIWYHIEHAIGLKYVIEKQMGEYPSEHFCYIQRISDAHHKLVQLQAKDEKDIAIYQELYEGFLDGEILELELWNEDITVRFNVNDTCCAVIRELCWLIAANDFHKRTEFFIGGQKEDCKLFWNRYHMYLAEIRKYKKVN